MIQYWQLQAVPLSCLLFRTSSIIWRRKWQLTPVFLVWKIPWTEEPGGLKPWGCKELDTTEHTHANSIIQDLFINLFLAVLGLHCCSGFSVIVVSGGLLSSYHGLLTVVASLVAEHGLQSTGSVIVVHRLSCSMACSMACGIFRTRDQTHISYIGRPPGKSRTKSIDWNREFLLMSREQRAGLGSSRLGMAVSMDKLNMGSVLELEFEH